MNIENWIKENSEIVQSVEESFIEYLAIEVEYLRELLKTHTIVPREPSENILEKLLTMNSVKARYKAMIKAAEEEE